MNYRLDNSDDDEPQPRVPLGDADDAAAAKVRYEAACKDKTKQAMAEADAARPPKISEQAAREFMAAKPTKFSYAARGGAGDSGNADALFVLDVPKKYSDSNSETSTTSRTTRPSTSRCARSRPRARTAASPAGKSTVHKEKANNGVPPINKYPDTA